MYSLLFLWAVTPSFATLSPPTYYPVGPQLGVTKQALLDGGWTLCWEDYYNSRNNLNDIFSQCNGDYLIYAGGATGADSYLLLAAGERSAVTTVTEQNQTTLNNGTYWYYHSGFGSIGFAPNSTISQNSADVHDSWDGDSGDLRLSWHSDGTDIFGGWRVGMNVGINGSADYQRAIWQTNSVNVVESYLNSPQNLTGQILEDNSVQLTWDAPEQSNISVERYAISWSVNNFEGGWGIATGNVGDENALNTTINISLALFEGTGGLNQNYQFKVRADNDSSSVYSSFSNTLDLYIADIKPTPTPEPSPEPSETIEEVPEIVLPNPVPSLSPSESPLPPVESEIAQDLIPELEISSPESSILIPDESPFPYLDLDTNSNDLPFDNDITDIEIDNFIEDFTESGDISDIETEQLIDNFLEDGEISEQEVLGLLDSLTKDEILSEDEKDLIVDVILEQADGNAISTELIDELGIDYEDLPDDQPVMLENGVILFAEVADALEIFENPSEILGAVFTDPGKALTAVANVGADMTPEKREESQKIVVASIIAVQAVAATNLITGRIV